MPLVGQYDWVKESRRKG